MSKPLFELGLGRFVAEAWFVQGEGKDWAGWLYRDGQGPWKLSTRFRYYRGEDPEADQKSDSHWTVKDGVTREDAARGMQRGADRIMEDWPGSTLYRLPIGSDNPPQIVEKLQRWRSSHLDRRGARR